MSPYNLLLAIPVCLTQQNDTEPHPDLRHTPSGWGCKQCRLWKCTALSQWNIGVVAALQARSNQGYGIDGKSISSSGVAWLVLRKRSLTFLFFFILSERYSFMFSIHRSHRAAFVNVHFKLQQHWDTILSSVHDGLFSLCTVSKGKQLWGISSKHRPQWEVLNCPSG